MLESIIYTLVNKVLTHEGDVSVRTAGAVLHTELGAVALPPSWERDFSFGRNLTTRAMRHQAPGKSLPVTAKVRSWCKAEQLAEQRAQRGEMRSSPAPQRSVGIGNIT